MRNHDSAVHKNLILLFYFTDQNFTPCTVSGEKDECKDCYPGLLMLDKIDTYLFEKIDCEPSGCTECDHRGMFNR